MIRSEVAKQLGMRSSRRSPSSPTPFPTALAPLEEVLARAKAQDEAVAALRVETYAGEEDPYKKPRELHDEDDEDDFDEDLKAADEDELEEN